MYSVPCPSSKLEDNSSQRPLYFNPWAHPCLYTSVCLHSTHRPSQCNPVSFLSSPAGFGSDPVGLEPGRSRKEISVNVWNICSHLRLRNVMDAVINGQQDQPTVDLAFTSKKFYPLDVSLHYVLAYSGKLLKLDYIRYCQLGCYLPPKKGNPTLFPGMKEVTRRQHVVWFLCLHLLLLGFAWSCLNRAKCRFMEHKPVTACKKWKHTFVIFIGSNLKLNVNLLRFLHMKLLRTVKCGHFNVLAVSSLSDLNPRSINILANSFTFTVNFKLFSFIMRRKQYCDFYWIIYFKSCMKIFLCNISV